MDDRLTFTDSNEDCLYIIFRHLNLMELLNMAETMPESLHTATSIFRQKYSHYVFTIMSDPRESDEEFRYEIQDEAEEIRFYHLELFQNVLQYFGNAVKRIAIENGKDNNLTMANRLVNEYCSESVKELDLEYISPNGLLQYSKPFSAVEKLSCTIGTELDGNFTLTHLFPKLQKLTILLRSGVNFNAIDCAFPLLKQLDLWIFPDCEERMHQIEGFIRKNPQIKSVQLRGKYSYLLKTVSEVTPNLQNFNVSLFENTHNNEVRFGNVNNFHLLSVSSEGFDKLSFLHLNSFELYYIHQDEQLIRFLNRHQHLNRLHIRYGVSRPVILYEADLPDLVEVIIEDHDVSIESINEFINSHPKLMKFQIRRNINADNQELLKIFEKDWNIQTFRYKNYEKFIFERKSVDLM